MRRLRDHRLAAADRGDRRAAARADDRRPRDRRAASAALTSTRFAVSASCSPSTASSPPASPSSASARPASTATTRPSARCRHLRRASDARPDALTAQMASVRLPLPGPAGASLARWRGSRPASSGSTRSCCRPRPARPGRRACSRGSTPSSRSPPRSASASPRLVVADVTVGLCLFVVVSFLEVLSQRRRSFGITKVFGLLLARPGSLRRASTKDGEQDFVTAHPDDDLRAGDLRRLVGAQHGLGGVPRRAAFHVELPLRARTLLLFLIVFTASASARTPCGCRRHSWRARRSPPCSRSSTGPTRGSTTSPRASGTVGDPNELASVLVAGVILAGVLFVAVEALTRPSPRRRERRRALRRSGSSSRSPGVDWSRLGSRPREPLRRRPLAPAVSR